MAAIDARFKTVYHAGSVMVCNYLTALMEAGLQCFEKAGLPRNTATEMMEPLVRETLEGEALDGFLGRVVVATLRDAGADVAVPRSADYDLTVPGVAGAGYTLGIEYQHTLVITLDGKTLTAAGKITLGDAKSGPSSVAFTPDGKILAKGGFGLGLWDPVSGEMRREETSGPRYSVETTRNMAGTVTAPPAEAMPMTSWFLYGTFIGMALTTPAMSAPAMV